ncbi:FecR family protein [Larkinella sp. GY13]|uniref:FecR family protein n=1 Tax=Larkinella sp. GY13 TaxID=3453720 RepID=UPI003EE98FD5
MHFPFERFSTVEDFLESDAFRRWMLEKRPEDQAFWRVWLAQNPDKRELYEQAVATFLAIQGKTAVPSRKQAKEKADEILDQLPDASPAIKPLFRGRWGPWATAAAVVILLVWWQLDQPVFQTGRMIGRQEEQPTRGDDWKLVKNGTDQSLVVVLPDNSSVLLSPDSQIRFRKQSHPSVREVYLQGEGFFEVAKNPAKPFIVYTSNLTTKVLGTCFQVRSFEKESTAFVKVKTGKVAVSSVKSPGKTVLLTVNEELRLNASAEKLVRHEHFLEKEPPSAPLAQPFAFNYTPVTEIFDQLEASYHMPIHYDRSLLKNCTFTGQLNDVPFLEKVRLICLTTASTFELVDNQVVIHSQGCN